jgi:hypothetical protein
MAPLIPNSKLIWFSRKEVRASLPGARSVAPKNLISAPRGESVFVGK